MSVTIDPNAVVKAANTRPDAEAAEKLAYEREVKKLGSRVTKTQANVIAKVITPASTKALTETPALKKALMAYADTGDSAQLSPEQRDALKKVVEQGRNASENPSQARRIWPRKVAAIVLSLEAKTPEAPAPEPEKKKA